MSELKDSLHKCNDTAAGPDDIHYQILKHLPPDAWETKLNIMNEIWRTGKFPEDRHKAVIMPIPKPGQDKTEATNNRPIALTSCIKINIKINNIVKCVNGTGFSLYVDDFCCCCCCCVVVLRPR